MEYFWITFQCVMGVFVPILILLVFISIARWIDGWRNQHEKENRRTEFFNTHWVLEKTESCGNPAFISLIFKNTTTKDCLSIAVERKDLA